MSFFDEADNGLDAQLEAEFLKDPQSFVQSRELFLEGTLRLGLPSPTTPAIRFCLYSDSLLNTGCSYQTHGQNSGQE
jgi:hypothetical protein